MLTVITVPIDDDFTRYYLIDGVLAGAVYSESEGIIPYSEMIDMAETDDIEFDITL